MVSEIFPAGSAAWSAGPVFAKGSTETAGALRPGTEAQAVSASGGHTPQHIEHARAQMALERRFEQAAGLRQTTERLAEARNRLEDLRERLEGIVKRYPPYPRDNPERIERLNQVTGLRKQIEELLRPMELAAETTDAQSAIHTAIPMLDPMGSDDREVAGALQAVEGMQERLSALQKRLWSDLFDDAGTAQAGGADAKALAGRAQLAAVGQPIGVHRDVFPGMD